MYWHLGAQDPQVTRGSSCVSTLHILYNVCIYIYISSIYVYTKQDPVPACIGKDFQSITIPSDCANANAQHGHSSFFLNGSTFIEVGEFFESRDLWAWAAHHQRGGGAFWPLQLWWDAEWPVNTCDDLNTLGFHFLFGDKFGGTDIFSGPPMRSQACFFEYVSRCLHLDVLLRFQCMLSKVPSWRSWIMMILLKIWH